MRQLFLSWFFLPLSVFLSGVFATISTGRRGWGRGKEEERRGCERHIAVHVYARQTRYSYEKVGLRRLDVTGRVKHKATVIAHKN